MKCVCQKKMNQIDPKTFTRSDLGGMYHCDCGWSLKYNRVHHTANWIYDKAGCFINLNNEKYARHASEGSKMWISDPNCVIERVNHAAKIFQTEEGKTALRFIDRINNLKVFL